MSFFVYFLRHHPTVSLCWPQDSPYHRPFASSCLLFRPCFPFCVEFIHHQFCAVLLLECNLCSIFSFLPIAPPTLPPKREKSDGLFQCVFPTTCILCHGEQQHFTFLFYSLSIQRSPGERSTFHRKLRYWNVNFNDLIRTITASLLVDVAFSTPGAVSPCPPGIDYRSCSCSSRRPGGGDDGNKITKYQLKSLTREKSVRYLFGVKRGERLVGSWSGTFFLRSIRHWQRGNDPVIICLHLLYRHHHHHHHQLWQPLAGRETLRTLRKCKFSST